MYTLTTGERTTEVSAFVGVISIAWGKLADWYMQRGVDWGRRMQINGGEYNGVSSTSNTVS